MLADLLTFDTLTTLSYALAMLTATGMVQSRDQLRLLAKRAAHGRTDA